VELRVIVLSGLLLLLLPVIDAQAEDENVMPIAISIGGTNVGLAGMQRLHPKSK
jgi:hypothetical protein